MLGLYYRIRDLLLNKYPVHDFKGGLSPEKYPTLYECRYAVNSLKPFAFHIACDGADKLSVGLFPALWSDHHNPYLIRRIFDSNGVSFTSDGVESFMITGPETLKKLSVFHLTHGDDSVDEYVPMTEKQLFKEILKYPGCFSLPPATQA